MTIYPDNRKRVDRHHHGQEGRRSDKSKKEDQPTHELAHLVQLLRQEYADAETSEGKGICERIARLLKVRLEM